MGLQASKLVFSTNGRFLAAASADGAVRVFGFASGQELRALEGQRSQVLQMAFSPDNQHLLIADSTQLLHVWDLVSRRELGEGTGHRGPIMGLMFLADGKRLVTAGGDATMRVWDALAGKELLPPSRNSIFNGMMALGNDGESICYTNGSHAILRWKPGQDDSGQVPPSQVGYSLVALAPDGGMAASHAGNNIRVIDGAGKELQTFGCRNYSQQFALSPGGRYVAATDAGPRGSGYQLRVWNIASGQETKVPDDESENRSYPSRMLFSPDARILAAAYYAGANNQVEAIESASGLLRWSVAVPQGLSLTAMAFSPTGRTLAIGLSDGSLRLADVATGVVASSPAIHRGAVQALAFSPAGTLLASGSADTTAIIWDVAKLRGQPGARPSAKATPDQIETWWRDLGATDGRRAHTAIAELAAQGDAAVLALRERRKAPRVKPTKEEISQWIKELDDDRFAVRRKAERSLAAAGADAQPLLARALDRATPDSRRRIDSLLKNVGDATLNTRLRTLRVAEVLDRMGTREARDVLEEWLKESDDAVVKDEIEKTLERMKGKM
jgi:WD40 repeat protein